MTSAAKAELGILCSDFERGGVERNLANFAGGLAQRGWAVTLLIGGTGQSLISALPSAVTVERLEARSSAARLERYLTERHPQVLLCAKYGDETQALGAKARLGTTTRLAFWIGTNLSRRMLDKPLGWLRFPFYARTLARHYRAADILLANSHEVADDLARLAHVPADRVSVVPNPVVTPRLHEMARQPVSHPWLESKDEPVLVAAGRLVAVKDYPTMLRALARLEANGRHGRLIVLGDGGRRARLSRLAERLGIASRVDFLGYTENPYPYIARADGVVLSSRREGSPNVLIESMALGVPVASTDCRSGPRELLRDGELGPLVPVGDSQALAGAIERILTDPVPPRELEAAAEAFTVDSSVETLERALAIGASP